MTESKCVGCDPELRVDLAAYDRITPGRANQITLARVNTPTRNILRKFDNNGDGRIDANEIQTIVTTLVAEKFKSKAFKIGLIILAVFTTILLGAMFGLTWAVVAALKDTQVQSGVLVTNDKEKEPVLVANLDVTVSDGFLVSRNSSTVLTTATVQTPGAITANTPFEKLASLQSLVLITGSNARYSLAIQGVARIPDNTTGDFIVRVQTAAGTLILENGTWSVSNMTGPLLEGFFTKPAGRGRRLSEDTLFTYGLCDGSDCGDVPCGLPGLFPCPVNGSIPDPGDDDYLPEPSQRDVNTGGSGSGCSAITGFVTVCSAGLTHCYGGTPTPTQRSRYMAQYGCTSNCGNWFLNMWGECEGTWSTMKRFCCV